MIKQLGFTLVELVMTIIIVGIMAVYAVPRLGSLATYDLTNAANELVEAIRFAQESSMLRVDSGYQIVTNDGSSDYRVQECAYANTTPVTCTTTSDINSPISSSSSYIQDGEIWNKISANGLSFSFDTRGYPCNAVAPCTAHMTVAQTITLTHTSGETTTVTIEPISGYAYVN